MSRRAKRRNQDSVFNIFNFSDTPPERPTPRLTTRPNRPFSVRLPPSTKGKLTTAQRLKLLKEKNARRLTQSAHRQQREREKAEACRKLLIRRKEDPNLVWDLTKEASLADQSNQPTQPDELVSDDDEDEHEHDFVQPPEVRKLFTSPERVQQLSRQTGAHSGHQTSSTYVTEISDDENLPTSRLKKRRVAIPASSSVFAPNVRKAISNRTTQQNNTMKHRTPLKTVNHPRKRSPYVSEISRSLREETAQKEWSRRQSNVGKGEQPRNSGSREMSFNMSTIRASNDSVQEVHQISDDEYATSYVDNRKLMQRTTPAVPGKASRQTLKRPRHGREPDRSIPAKTFYGKNKTSKSKTERRRERIVIPLLKGEKVEVPSKEVAQLNLHEQPSNQWGERYESSGEKRSRRHVRCGGIQEESTDEDNESTKSQIDIRFKSLSIPELEVVRSLTFKVSKNKVMAKISEANIELKAGDFSGLRGSRWLNDEILNSFVALVNARNRTQVDSGPISKESATDNDEKNEEDDEIMEVAVTSAKPMEVFRRPRPRTHVFNTFFFSRLSQHGYDYNGVRRWLKKAGRDIKTLDLIMFPINLSNFHWVLAAIDLRGKQFLYLDSTYGNDSSGTIPLLRRWLHDEVANKHGEKAAEDMQIDSWGLIVNPAYLPRQRDGGSCGIFTLYMAEYLERGRRPDFTQENIRTLRQRTALFLKRGKLPDS